MNLLCRIFGHKDNKNGYFYTQTYYKHWNNGSNNPFAKTKRRRKVKVVKYFLKCKRCGKYYQISKEQGEKLSGKR